jgi:hypothetical protein
VVLRRLRPEMLDIRMVRSLTNARRFDAESFLKGEVVDLTLSCDALADERQVEYTRDPKWYAVSPCLIAANRAINY